MVVCYTTLHCCSCIVVLRANGIWQELDGRALRVNSGPAPRRSDTPLSRMGNSSRGSSSNSSNRVFVGNLSWGVDDMALETLFSEQGKVLEARVVYDRESGRSRGFGFVSYGSAQEVNSAIESLDGVVSLFGRIFHYYVTAMLSISRIILWYLHDCSLVQAHGSGFSIRDGLNLLTSCQYRT